MSPDAFDGAASRGDGAQMTTEDVWAFLTDRGTGVLSLSGDPPYSLPMSFAVDSAVGTLVFQALSGPGAAKDDYLDDGAGASLVTFDWSTPDDWASAVVTGELSPVEGTPERTAAFARQADSVGLSAFGAQIEDLSATWYELKPSSVTGRSGPDWERANTFGETR